MATTQADCWRQREQYVPLRRSQRKIRSWSHLESGIVVENEQTLVGPDGQVYARLFVCAFPCPQVSSI
jgi:hypothetical protein